MKSARRSPRLPRSSAKSPAGQSGSDSRERSQRKQSVSASRERPQRSSSRKRVSEEISVQKSDVSAAPLPLIDVQNFQRKVVTGRIYPFVDSFCWICHKPCDDVICDDCPRAYHTYCFTKHSASECDCKRRNVDGRNPHFIVTPVELKNLLQHAIHEARKEDKKNTHKNQKAKDNTFNRLFQTWPIVRENHLLMKIVDLGYLSDLVINTPPYQSTAHFFSDVKYIYHNCFILYGADDERTQVALKLQKNFLRELIDIEACRDCYQNKISAQYDRDYTNWFIKVCRAPHHIVWAKLRGSPFWPAKCLKIQNGHADVRFFGTHDKSVILLKQVYRISKAHPEGKNMKKNGKLCEAMDELDLYISNYENTVGSFKFFEKKTPIQETLSKGKKKPRRKEKCNPPLFPEKMSTSDPVEAKCKAFLHAPSTSSEDDFPEPVNNVDSDTSVLCQMTFTADVENSDLTSDNLTNRFATFDSSENISDNESADEAPDLIQDSQSLPSGKFINSATVSKKEIVGPFPVISSISQSSEEDTTNNIPSTHDHLAAKSDTYEPEVQSASGKQLQVYNISATLEEEEDSDNDVQVVSETPASRLSDFYFNTPGLDKILSEMLISNKPRYRELYDLYRNFTSRIFFLMCVETMDHRVNPEKKQTVETLVLEIIKRLEWFKTKKIELEEKVKVLEKKLSENDKGISKQEKGIRETEEKVRELEEKIKIEIKKREEIEMKYETCQQQLAITRKLLQKTLENSVDIRKHVEKCNVELYDLLLKEEKKAKSLDMENKELKLRIDKILKEKDELTMHNQEILEEKDKLKKHIQEILEEKDKQSSFETGSAKKSDKIHMNSDDCQPTLTEDYIRSEQNEAVIKIPSDSAFKNQEGSQIHCDDHSNTCTDQVPQVSQQSFFVNTNIDGNGNLVLHQQRNMARIENTSNGPMLVETSIMSGCAFETAVPSATFIQVPVVVQPSPIVQPLSSSYVSSDISYSCVIASTSSQSNTVMFQPNTSVYTSTPKTTKASSSSHPKAGSSSNPKASSSSRPTKASRSSSRKTSKSKVSGNKSSHVLKRPMAETKAPSTKKYKKH